jgi:DHA1 family bicyclomycin/chloramphenicol resistance-like MFS transporter
MEWKIDYYSPSFILVVSATYIALFYNTPSDVRVLLLFFAMQFFSIGFLLVIYGYGARGTHCGYCRSGYRLYFYYHGCSYQYFIGRFIADRALPLFVAFRYVQHYQSDYLFKK